VAARANPPVAKLVDWMIKFQFDNECDYFNLDPVAYAPALGDIGMVSYRKTLAEVEARIGPRPPKDQKWSSPHSGEWFTLDWNAQRLAVLDRDIEAIIRTHARDRRVAAWLEDTAEAFEEIGEIDLAIDWAKQATNFDRGHQSLKAADFWCKLLAEHRPGELLDARVTRVSPVAVLLHGGVSVSGRREGLARLSQRGCRAPRGQPTRCRAVRPALSQGRAVRMEPGPLARA
jgi:hypothetical protein